MSDLAVHRTDIPGLLLVDLVTHGDNRGWFKENWHRQKLVDRGLPDFGPVQNNVSFNTGRVTRGVHAEPWDKFISVASGKIFGAWVDLRTGESFGRVVTAELGPDRAVFVPRGVGNAFQTLADETVYSYLVNEHWSPAAKESYTFVNLADPALGIAWPTPLEQTELSDADRNHPLLADVTPMQPGRTVIIGAGGQLGQALTERLPDAVALGHGDVDLADPDSIRGHDWSGVDVIINAAAWTDVDGAETPEGRPRAWAVNATGVGVLAEVARARRCRLVHVSSDYVFDGTTPVHTEDEPLSPLGVYGQTKAAGDLLVGSLERHYLLRTSWVVGTGSNFVRTMASLAERGVDPSVINDQIGRPTFTDELAAAIAHLLETHAPYGTYNLSAAGEPASWADLARAVFSAGGHDPERVTRVSTAEYTRGKSTAPRPPHSTLDLTKITEAGFRPAPWPDSLARYLNG